MIDSRTAGSRYATRVRIAAPQGSAFNGAKGTLVSVRGDTLLIRLSTRTGLVLAFGRGEVEVIA